MKQQVTRFFFSFRSPYSWMAARMLEERFPSAPERIEYVPFWEPDSTTTKLLQSLGGEFLYTPMSRQKHLYILQDIKRLSAKLGYEMSWPVDRTPWWDLPHLAYLMARRLGRAREFFWAVYGARWERAEDVCSVSVIRHLAEQVGVDADKLASAPDDQELRMEGAQALYRCYQGGVFGIPFFVHGHDKFWGVDRFEDFATIWSKQEDRK